MKEAEGFMEKKIIRAFAAVSMGLVFAVTLCSTALAQEAQVSGTVTSSTGERLPGVTVQVRGATTTTTTDANGRYNIAAPGDGVLLFALIGYRGAARTIGGRNSIDGGIVQAGIVLVWRDGFDGAFFDVHGFASLFRCAIMPGRPDAVNVSRFRLRSAYCLPLFQ